MDFSFGIGVDRFFSLGARVVGLKAFNAPASLYSHHFRTSVCKFQWTYTEFHFQASRLHRNFKRSLERESGDCDDRFNTLNSFLQNGIKKICGEVAESIQDYFITTHPADTKPRVGIHAIDEDDNVIDIIMIPHQNSNSPKKIGEYTVFREICEGGLPYLNNNLPKAIRNNHDFCHKGIDVAKVRSSYGCKKTDWKPISRWRNRLFKGTPEDRDWAAMSSSGPPSHQSLYKSHLVVPITFRGHAEKGRMDDATIKVLQLPEDGRSILGFVCVDHPVTYYFDDQPAYSFDNVDINTLYVFADLLSFVFVTHLMYTKGSTSYKRFESCMEQPVNEGT